MIGQIFHNSIAFSSLKGGGYSYGFNGAEKTSEWQSEEYDLGARMYDPRLGRMRSIDPRASEYAWQSPYVYHRNSPVSSIDFNGEGDGDTEGDSKMEWDNTQQMQIGDYHYMGSLDGVAYYQRVISTATSSTNNGDGSETETTTMVVQLAFFESSGDDGHLVEGPMMNVIAQRDFFAGSPSGSQYGPATITASLQQGFGLGFYSSLYSGGNSSNSGTMKELMGYSSDLSLGLSGANASPFLYSKYKFNQGWRYSSSSGSNYLLTGRNASQFAGYGGLKTLPRYFSTFTKAASYTSVGLGIAGLAYDGYLVSQGQMSVGRAAYHTTGFVTSLWVGASVGALYGGPVGAVAGFAASFAFYGAEVMYDEITRPGGTIDFFDDIKWDFYEFNYNVNNNWFRPQL